MKWEYRVRAINFNDPAGVRKTLDESGEEAWELVAIFPKALGVSHADEMWGTERYSNGHRPRLESA